MDIVPEPVRRARRTKQFAAASRAELDLVVYEVPPLELCGVIGAERMG